MTEIILYFNIIGHALHVTKKIVMPILPVETPINCFDETFEGDTPEISHYYRRSDGSIECHFDIEGFLERDIPWLISQGFVVVSH